MRKALEIEILEKRALGLGFDDLLAGAASELFLKNKDDIDELLTFYNLALKSEEDNNLIEAIYYYRHIVSIFEKRKNSLSGHSVELALKSMNNLGVICYELSRYEDALLWFEKILHFEPANEMAKENLEIIKREKS